MSTLYIHPNDVAFQIKSGSRWETVYTQPKTHSQFRGSRSGEVPYRYITESGEVIYAWQPSKVKKPKPTTPYAGSWAQMMKEKS